MESAFSKLNQSISGNDTYIGIAATVCLCCLIATIIGSFIAGKIPQNEKKFLSTMYYSLSTLYLLFVTMVSLFPLLGMFGTVRALLELDLAGDTELIKQRFFDALTSTAWGIIFSAVFKLLNAFIQTYAETQIENLKHLLDTKRKSS